MCKEHAHLASTTGPSLPASPVDSHMEALEVAAAKDPGLRRKLAEWAQKFASIVM